MSGLQEEQWWELEDVHISYYFMSDFLFNSLSVFIGETGFRAGREREDGGSHVEAFTTTTCALDVGIVEDEFTGQL